MITGTVRCPFPFIWATESRFKTMFYIAMRKRSNPTNRTSYIRFCDLLAIFGVRLTKCRYPDQPENGFGGHCRIVGLQPHAGNRPVSEARPALWADSSVVGELGR